MLSQLVFSLIVTTSTGTVSVTNFPSAASCEGAKQAVLYGFAKAGEAAKENNVIQKDFIAHAKCYNLSPRYMPQMYRGFTSKF